MKRLLVAALLGLSSHSALAFTNSLGDALLFLGSADDPALQAYYHDWIAEEITLLDQDKERSAKICWPDDFSEQRAVLEVSRYLTTHPDQSGELPSALIQQAMEQSFPCAI